MVLPSCTMYNGLRMRFSLVFLSLLLLASAFDFEDNYQMAVKRGLFGRSFGMDTMPAHLRKFMKVQNKRGYNDAYYR